jgi:tyrosyl-tRNA synthetase
MDNFFNFLEKRGLVNQISDDELKNKINTEEFSFYCGFDPTAKSLHLGHLLPVMLCAQLQRKGHSPILLVGGATGLIGDPSGKSSERTLLSIEEVEDNAGYIKKQLMKFMDFSGKNKAIMVNNYDWFKKISFLECLRDIGKYFSVNYMIAKDSVSKRLNEREQGISYTEFSYMILQAYDYYHLYENYKCIMQCGGADQWGNISSGIEFIRKVKQETAYGMTVPLLTTASGQKFGKSEGNAIWLDENQTTPYDFYQYWVRSDDRDAIKYLNLFTFLSDKEIADLQDSMAKSPEKREAQKELAYHVTSIAHSEDTARKIREASEILYSERIKDIDDVTFNMIFKQAPVVEVSADAVSAGINIISFLTDSKLAPSKSEARRLLTGGSVYINNNRVNENYIINNESQFKKNLILYRKGKKDYCLIKII